MLFALNRLDGHCDQYAGKVHVRTRFLIKQLLKDNSPSIIMKRAIVLSIAKRDGARDQTHTIIGPFVDGNGNNCSVTVSSNLAIANMKPI